MVVFNYSGKEINAKIVYYGPGLSGKTTNLERIYGHVPEQRRGKMVSMKTRSDRTLFFDFLPVNAGEIRGFRTRFLLYTVPGQVHYNATRKLVLKGTDAIIFVADSDPALRQANIESMQNLEQNLAEYQLSLEKIPVILQFNKRDLSNALTPDELNADLNHHDWPWFQAVAVNNEGVWETFRAATRALFESLERTLGGEEKGKQEREEAARGRAETSEAGKVPADPRFRPSAATYDGSGTVDDVVRLSDSLKSWGPGGAASSEEKERAVPAGGVDLPADPDRAVGPSPADPPLPMAEGPPPRVVERVPPPRDEVGAPERARETARVPAAPVPPPVETIPAITARVDALAADGVVRVPVEIDGGRGRVRIEIALEIRLLSPDGRKEKERGREEERVGSLDSGPGWS